jgi:hypothetical protein
MNNVLLINLNDILHYTGTNGSIDPVKIEPHIQNAQILYLEPILGSDLFNKIIDLVDTNDITGTTYKDYQTLLFDYITPSLVFHTMELFIPLNSFQIAAGGTFQFIPTNAQYSPLDDIDRLANKYKIIGGKYDTKLSEYLCKNSSKFVEYTSNTGLINKTEVTQQTGWYLGLNNIYNKIRT